MAQEQKESIDRTFVQFIQPDLGFRTGVVTIPGQETQSDRDLKMTQGFLTLKLTCCHYTRPVIMSLYMLVFIVETPAWKDRKKLVTVIIAVIDTPNVSNVLCPPSFNCFQSGFFVIASNLVA